MTVCDAIPVTKVCAFIVFSDTVHLKCPNANLCGFLRGTRQHSMPPATHLPEAGAVAQSGPLPAKCGVGHCGVSSLVLSSGGLCCEN